MTAPDAGWLPERRALRVRGLLIAFLITTAGVYLGIWLMPGVELESSSAAFAVAATLALLNAVLPPIVAAVRIPYAFPLGFVLILLLDGAMLWIAGEVLSGDVHVSSIWAALAAALLISACSMAIGSLLGSDDEVVALAVLRRVARRQGIIHRGDAPGIVYLEIDGLAEPVLRRAMAAGSAPNLQRWIERDGHRIAEWETDLSSQTAASQAGILLGSNEDIPAFRWVEKDTGRIVVSSSPDDCAMIEARHAGHGLLTDGGASRGNLLSGEADHVILTVSRLNEEKRANPGYRAFLADGANVSRALVLFFTEVGLEWIAAKRQRRRGITPRGHRAGRYPFLRATMCTLVRDLIVFAVLNDMMRGRPAVYATFSSYDEVAHHSGLERADTLEALRKLDERFQRIDRMRRYAPRPYEIVVLSDHGQTQGATFRQRHGYGLDDLVERSLSRGEVAGMEGGDEQQAMVGHAVREAGGATPADDQAKDDGGIGDREAVVMGSGNLGLVYLMDVAHRMTLEEIELRHPDLIGALRDHEHIGWLLVRSAEHGALVLGPRGSHRLADGQVEGEDPLAPFAPNAARHLLRTDGFAHCADIMVGSFYDPVLEEGCAFEELICFHGGLGGPQTRPFILYDPTRLTLPDEPLVGAAAVHDLLAGWRATLQPRDAAPPPAVAPGPAAAPAPPA